MKSVLQSQNPVAVQLFGAEHDCCNFSNSDPCWYCRYIVGDGSVNRYRLQVGKVVWFEQADNAQAALLKARLAGVHGRILVRKSISPWEFK